MQTCLQKEAGSRLNLKFCHATAFVFTLVVKITAIMYLKLRNLILPESETMESLSLLGAIYFCGHHFCDSDLNHKWCMSAVRLCDCSGLFQKVTCAYSDVIL